MHRVKFTHVREKHPTRGCSFLEACDPGIMDLVDEFAAAGEGVSHLSIDAALKRDDKLLHVLLTARANVNCQTSAGETSFLAARNGHVGIARALIAAGADMNLAMHIGATPMYIAAQNGEVEIVRALIEAGAYVR